MSSPDNYISIAISLVQPGVSTPGFGTPLILSATADFAERTRLYTDTDGMVTDGFAADSPEVLAAGAMFAQSPHVPQVKIGRLALPPTLVYVVGVANVRDSHQYAINVKGEGVTATEVLSVATDGSATNDEAVALIVTALNLVVGKNYTAVATGSVGSKVVTVTATAAGDWFSLEVDPDLTVKMTHVDPGYATDLAAITLEDPDWFLVYNSFNSDAVSAAIATWCETNKRGFWMDTNQTDSVTTSTGNGDPIDDLNTAGWSYSMGIYHPDPSEFAGAAWAGRYLCTSPGKATASLKNLAGISAVNLTATQRANLVAKRGNSYERVFGTNVTFNGTVPSTQYRFFDVRRDIDAWTIDMQASGFGALQSLDKIGFTDDDTPTIAAAIRGANARAEEQPGSANTFARGSTFCTIPLVGSVSANDKANRLLSGVKAGGTLAGAVHSVSVVASISF
jgi:hypothetical protein